jgi:TolB-like protein/class 3 adenylate cyclase
MPGAPDIVPQRRRAALLFADIAGYSRSMQRDELGTWQRVQQAIELLRVLVEDYGGRLVDTAGDGVFAVFDSAPLALRFALAAQREFRDQAVWSVAGERLAFRIGIHEGEVLVAGARVAGHHVNVAARIEALAPPGGICVTGPVRRAVGGEEGLAFRSLGLARLRHIEEPLEVFAVEDAAGAAAPAEPPAEPAGERAALPLDLASVVVLPIVPLSGDPADRHLVDGLTADLIGHLSRFRDLFVVARHTAFRFRDTGEDPATVARRLGVRYVLTGSLRRSGPRIRLEIGLDDVGSGRALWRERYEGRLDDIFAFEDDVVTTLAARLAVRITEQEKRRALSRPPGELRAYGLVLRGWELTLTWRRAETLHARRLFTRARELDPEYGRAWVGLSRTFNISWRYRFEEDPAACLEQAVGLAREAIACDPLDARGFAELGFAELYRKHHEAALAAYREARELNPNDADIMVETADALVYTGEAERAIGLIGRAMAHNPYHPDWYLWVLADARFTLGDYEGTLEALARMRDPSQAHRMAAAACALLGRMEEARVHACAVKRVQPDFSIEQWRQVPPYRDPEPLERFVAGLRLAGLE